jgi:hypothetical protein
MPKSWRLHSKVGTQVFLGGPVADGALLVDAPVQDGRVRRVDLAFHRLQPVALLHAQAHVHVLLGHQVPLEVGQRRQVVAVGPHVGPGDAVALAAGVVLDLDRFLQAALRGLGRGVEHVAVHAELPAVVDAAHAAVLVAPEHQRRTAVRAGMVDQADAAIAVAKRQQLLAEQAHALRLAVGLEVAAGEKRNPVEAHQLPHGGVGADADECLVVFVREHGSVFLDGACSLTGHTMWCDHFGRPNW